MTAPALFGNDAALAPRPEPAPVAAQTQSLYRKYRPQTFEEGELVGQEHVVRTLQRAIEFDRVAHAYLFCGPRGTGKTTTARLLAKAVNCLDPDVRKRPCNVCANCRAIASGATADVIEIDAASNRGIDDIRDLRERVKYAPTHLSTKFYIIDEAHQITGAAANAFLKTLEEPPAHIKFVLATTDPEELLPTIVSRCQRFDFRRIGIEAMVGRLRSVAESEGLAIDEPAMQAIARHATGSLRDALGLLDQLAVYGGEDAVATRTIDLTSVLELLGVSRNDRVERLVEALATRDPALALSTVNAAIDAGEDARQLNRQLVAYLRVLLYERAGGSPDADQRAKALAERFELHDLSRLARVFAETDYKIRHSPYAQLPLEIAMVDAILGFGTPAQSGVVASRLDQQSSAPERNLPPATTVEVPAESPPATTLKDRLRGGGRGGHLQVVREERNAESVNATEPDLSPQAPPERPPAVPGAMPTVDQFADLWPRIRADVKAVNRRIEALLASIDPVAVQGSTLTLAAAYEFHRKRMSDDDVRRVVEEAITRIVGQPVAITCVLRGDIGGQAPPAAARVETTEDAVGPRIQSDADTADIDEQRITAAKNILDAEEIPT